MLEFLVVRHGQSIADLEGRMEGRADFPMSDHGHEQAEKAGLWMANNCRPDLILSSPLLRASQTARHIAAQTGVAFHEVAALMEIDIGMVGGLTRTEADEKYPVPPGGFQPHEPHGITGESDMDLWIRADRFLSRLLSEHTNTSRRICIISHGNMISTLFHCFLNLPIHMKVWLDTGDTGMHLWGADGASRRILFTNRQEHLRD